MFCIGRRSVFLFGKGWLVVDGDCHPIGHTDGALRLMVQPAKAYAEVVGTVGGKEAYPVVRNFQHHFGSIFRQVDGPVQRGARFRGRCFYPPKSVHMPADPANVP